MSRLYATRVEIPSGDDYDEDAPKGMPKVQYTNEVNELTTNHLKPVFRIFNTSSKSIPLSYIKSKYWYTFEADTIPTTTFTLCMQLAIRRVASPPLVHPINPTTLLSMPSCFNTQFIAC
ncbi:type 3a cellulose-binding domain protein [Pseudobacteroides cellulosolvens ATCC 35603 = DSM 2933]|uniref:Type 3a cellulose-binding domain protein n=1 Tax=Pseudobacteroides cellulosolvens ATCC 35603 = DSM 2933 TaxID=398512 RepID=A0A0L6JQP9_9FIRM|nr:cellulose binding domain-containing protein [Pseudobacteroides cellulosolvens]KNY28166.1 type 3a cellulose-binding domain protein [Pseudobacteroides cellulosolvens ATCC 35603 = DSM 2933]